MTPGADDGDIAIAVGPPDRNSEAGKLGQQDWRRVAVVIVGAHADHADGRMRSREESERRVRGPVVRNLEHVRPQVHSACKHGVLGLDFSVTRQQDSFSAHRCPQDHG